MVNMRTASATVYIAFSSSRSVALNERNMLQNKTLTIKFYHCTMSEIQTQVFALSDVLALVSIHCADQKQHSICDFLTKALDITLQLCVDTANEYLQAYNLGGCVKNHLFWSLHEFKRAVYTTFLLTIVFSN